MWDDGKSVGEIVKIIKCDKGTVREALLAHEGYSVHESLSRRKTQRKGVNKYSLDGVFIEHYDSILEAANYDKNMASGIGGCCNMKHSQAYGYQWRFDGDCAPTPLKNVKYGKRKIVQLDIDKQVLKIFDSAAAAAREVAPNCNVNSASGSIIQVCKGKRQTAYGYGWQYSS